MGLHDLTMYRGDERVFTMTATANGAALNLTGASMRFTAKREVADTDANAVIGPLTVGAGITITNAAGGIFTVTIPESETEALTEKTKLVWDVEVTIGGVRRTLPEDSTGKPTVGTLTIFMDVSSA